MYIQLIITGLQLFLQIKYKNLNKANNQHREWSIIQVQCKIKYNP